MNFKRLFIELSYAPFLKSSCVYREFFFALLDWLEAKLRKTIFSLFQWSHGQFIRQCMGANFSILNWGKKRGHWTPAELLSTILFLLILLYSDRFGNQPIPSAVTSTHPMLHTLYHEPIKRVGLPLTPINNFAHPRHRRLEVIIHFSVNKLWLFVHESGILLYIVFCRFYKITNLNDVYPTRLQWNIIT